jgi:hypothetical protein
MESTPISGTGKSDTLLDVPKHLPEDAYCPVFLAKLSEVERVALRKTPAIDLDNIHAELDKRTTRS